MAMGRGLGSIRGTVCIARGTVYCGQQPGGAGKCGAAIRTALRSVPLPGLLAEDATCHPAEFSYLQPERTGTEAAVGFVWRIFCGGSNFDGVETASAQRFHRGRTRRGGAGWIRRVA